MGLPELCIYMYTQTGLHWVELESPTQTETLGSLSNNYGDGYEKDTLKVKSRCFKLYRVYSISFSSSNVGNCFWSRILKDCNEVQEKKNKVVVLRSRSPQNVKLGIFTT